MDRERHIIQIILQSLSKSFGNVNEFFESDAVIFLMGDQKMLFTVDEFSAEDHFRDTDAFTLGWNLAVATLSDILGSGGDPKWFGHSVTIPDKWDDTFIKNCSAGIAQCLEESKASFIGGDIGSGDSWHYTGIAIGSSESQLTRKGAKAGDLIYMTGLVGSGNFEAACDIYSHLPLLGPIIKKHKVRFPLRLSESKVIRNYATSCIDSSDGIMRALLTLSEINQTGFIVDKLNYLSEGKLACKLLGKPVEMLCLAECGEYELVFTCPLEKEKVLLEEGESKNLKFNKLGVVTEDKKYLFNMKGNRIDFTNHSLFARDFDNTSEYLAALEKYIRNAKQS
jgi:thiamine-monophosphate kinase